MSRDEMDSILKGDGVDSIRLIGFVSEGVLFKHMDCDGVVSTGVIPRDAPEYEEASAALLAYIEVPYAPV